MAQLWLPSTETNIYTLSTSGPGGVPIVRNVGYGTPIIDTDPIILEELLHGFPLLAAASQRDGIPLNGAVNYVRNPSVETNTTDLNSFTGSTGGTGGSTSMARITSDFRYGSACSQCSITPQTGGTGNYAAIFHQNYTTLANLQATAQPVVPGQTSWFTGSMKVVSGNVSKLNLYARYHDAGGNFLTQVSPASQTTPTTGTWYDLAGSFVAPAQAAYCVLRFQPDIADSNPVVVLTDGAGVFDANPYGYFDGASPGAEWEGTAHASRSHRRVLNEARNPSVASALTWWASGTSGGPTVTTPIARQTADSIDGHATETTYQSNTTINGSMQTYASPTSVSAGAVRCNPGEVFSASIWLKVVGNLSGVRLVRCDIGFKDSSSAFINQYSGTAVAPTGGWQFCKVENIVAPANMGLNGVAYMSAVAIASGTDAPTTMRCDQAMLVRQPALPKLYIAGDQPGGVWTGTANDSASAQLI